MTDFAFATGSPTAWLLALAGGAGLASLYFRGLWLTVSHLPRSTRPLLLLAASLALRMGFLLAALWLLARQAAPGQLLLALAGFMLWRIVALPRHAAGESHP